jgi:hypothetical protein
MEDAERGRKTHRNLDLLNLDRGLCCLVVVLLVVFEVGVGGSDGRVRPISLQVAMRTWSGSPEQRIKTHSLGRNGLADVQGVHLDADAGKDAIEDKERREVFRSHRGGGVGCGLGAERVAFEGWSVKASPHC